MGYEGSGRVPFEDAIIDCGRYGAVIDALPSPLHFRAWQFLYDVELLCRRRLRLGASAGGFTDKISFNGFFARFAYTVRQSGERLIPTLKLLLFRIGEPSGPASDDEDQTVIIVRDGKEVSIPVTGRPKKRRNSNRHSKEFICDLRSPSHSGGRAMALLLAGTVLASGPVVIDLLRDAHLEQGQQPATAPVNRLTPARQTVRVVTGQAIHTLRVEGAQRIEPETVLRYTRLRVGEKYDAGTLDRALKDLLASELFADCSIAGTETGDIVLRVRENPIINRVIFEGNTHLRRDEIFAEVTLKPRQIFTRTAVRQDVGRVVELYRRQGRFAAIVTPKMISLDGNRVDVVFEINEGPKSKVRQRGIVANDLFADGGLSKQMATGQARSFRLLSSDTSHDQDRLARDQQKLRQFYLTEGYANFRVTNAVAGLTPDKRDFRRVEGSTDSLSQAAGLFGYAFTDVSLGYTPEHDKLTMGVNFHIAQAQRTYVEKVEINGNTQTQDRVIRREIRLAEGDAFNSFQVKPSNDRINSLGYFRDKFEIKQNKVTATDRVVLESNIEEESTGQIERSAGYASLERFILPANIAHRNFRGNGQALRAGVIYSVRPKSVEPGCAGPRVVNPDVLIGGDGFGPTCRILNYPGYERPTEYVHGAIGFQLITRTSAVGRLGIFDISGQPCGHVDLSTPDYDSGLIRIPGIIPMNGSRVQLSKQDERDIRVLIPSVGGEVSAFRRRAGLNSGISGDAKHLGRYVLKRRSVGIAGAGFWTQRALSNGNDHNLVFWNRGANTDLTAAFGSYTTCAGWPDIGILPGGASDGLHLRRASLFMKESAALTGILGSGMTSGADVNSGRVVMSSRRVQIITKAIARMISARSGSAGFPVEKMA